MKKLVALLLVFIGCLSISAGAHAADYVPFASENISSTPMTVGKSGKNVSASGSVKCNSVVDSIVITSIALYEKQGAKWVLMDSASNVSKTDATSLRKTLSCTGVSGREYKLIMSGYVTNNGTTETFGPKTSSIYTFK